jgi:hypothetical protein
MSKQRNKILITLLYHLWTSADFESDFQSDWLAVFQFLQDGRFDEIPNGVLEMIEIWTDDYFIEEGN